MHIYTCTHEHAHDLYTHIHTSKAAQAPLPTHIVTQTPNSSLSTTMATPNPNPSLHATTGPTGASGARNHTDNHTDISSPSMHQVSSNSMGVVKAAGARHLSDFSACSHSSVGDSSAGVPNHADVRTFQNSANFAGLPATGVRSHADMRSHGTHHSSSSSSVGFAQRDIPAKRPKYAPETVPNKTMERVNSYSCIHTYYLCISIYSCKLWPHDYAFICTSTVTPRGPNTHMRQCEIDQFTKR
jgi:hypothetical protein